MQPPDGPNRRRRGSELETAILEAAWSILVEDGYSGISFEAIAARASTSRPVISRRWAGRSELLRAAVRRHGETHPPVVPDTGSLRGDVLAILRRVNAEQAEFIAVVGLQLSEYFDESGTTPAELRLDLRGDRDTSMTTVLDRAVARGEIERDRLSERVVAVPLSLLRHDVLMGLHRLDDRALVSIVDDVFLPLVL